MRLIDHGCSVPLKQDSQIAALACISVSISAAVE